MKPFLGARFELKVGIPTVVESDALDFPRGVVFEDDGETGYFYARDLALEGTLFVDALHIYTVKGVREPEQSVKLRIVWSSDWTKAALLLNNLPHAMFDFERRIGFSIDVFPEADPRTGWVRLPWSAELKRYFYSEEE